MYNYKNKSATNYIFILEKEVVAKSHVRSECETVEIYLFINNPKINLTASHQTYQLTSLNLRTAHVKVPHSNIILQAT